MPNTITRIITLLTGKEVGQDLLGNKYFQHKKGQKLGGRIRRWIIYKDQDQAKDIPPLCHAWLHHTLDEFPPLNTQEINTPTKPYNPQGTLKQPSPASPASPRPQAIGDYQAWRP